MSESEWFALNRASWNSRTPLHLRSGFYALEAFRAGQSSLRSIELEQVGDVRGRAPGEPIVSEQSGTYADPSAPVQLRDVGFNHGLGSVVSALLAEGLALERLTELDWSPYDIFPDMEEVAPGRFRIRRFGRSLPLVYGLVARGPS
jgi:hypothetical protein